MRTADSGVTDRVASRSSHGSASTYSAVLVALVPMTSGLSGGPHQHTPHGLVRDCEPLGAHGVADCHQAGARLMHLPDRADRGLLRGLGDQVVRIAAAVPERHAAALVPAGAPQIALGILDPLGDQRAFELRDRRQDRNGQLGNSVAGDVAQVEQPQRNPAPLKILNGLQRVKGRAKTAVHAGRNDDIAGPQRGQQPGAFGPASERCRAADAGIDINVFEPPVHLGGARLDLAALLVKADAAVGLLLGRDPAIAKAARLLGGGVFG